VIAVDVERPRVGVVLPDAVGIRSQAVEERED
jgi:hypothetical protein